MFMLSLVLFFFLHSLLLCSFINRFILDTKPISYWTAKRPSRLCIPEFHLQTDYFLHLLHTSDQTIELILGCIASRSPSNFTARLSCSTLSRQQSGVEVNKAKMLFFEGTKGCCRKGAYRGHVWSCIDSCGQKGEEHVRDRIRASLILRRGKWKGVDR